MRKITLLELREAWGFTLFQLRHVMQLQHIVSLEHDVLYLVLSGRDVTIDQAELLLSSIYLLTGTRYCLEDIDIHVEEASE
ncbi:MAG: hypothetical protein H0V70_05895 [Ktedonobacteraceae bacterium]|jgi:hypothetical protein|nr:hypothetical protein [Ktedonobacteraceae bacterium]